MNDDARDIPYDALAVGESASFTVTVTRALIRDFTRISGDRNPLHVDSAYANKTSFKGPVAHGMIIGAFFSRLIGMYLPGKYSLYLSQTIRFHSAVIPGTKITIRGEVTHKSDAHRTVTVTMAAEDNATKKLFASGEAMVQLLK